MEGIKILIVLIFMAPVSSRRPRCHKWWFYDNSAHDCTPCGVCNDVFETAFHLECQEPVPCMGKEHLSCGSKLPKSFQCYKDKTYLGSTCSGQCNGTQIDTQCIYKDGKTQWDVEDMIVASCTKEEYISGVWTTPTANQPHGTQTDDTDSVAIGKLNERFPPDLQSYAGSFANSPYLFAVLVSVVCLLMVFSGMVLLWRLCPHCCSRTPGGNDRTCTCAAKSLIVFIRRRIRRNENNRERRPDFELEQIYSSLAHFPSINHPVVNARTSRTSSTITETDADIHVPARPGTPGASLSGASSAEQPAAGRLIDSVRPGCSAQSTSEEDCPDATGVKNIDSSVRSSDISTNLETFDSERISLRTTSPRIPGLTPGTSAPTGHVSSAPPPPQEISAPPQDWRLRRTHSGPVEASDDYCDSADSSGLGTASQHLLDDGTRVKQPLLTRSRPEPVQNAYESRSSINSTSGFGSANNF